MAYLFAFQFWYCELCEENQLRGRQKALYFQFFILWQCFKCFNHRWVMGRGVGQVRYKLHLFPTRIFVKAISMTHSDMYQLDISTFYFYEPLLLQILIPYQVIKTYDFPCQLSLLQSTIMQITISINIFVSDIVQHEISFFIKVHINKVFFIFKFDLNVKHCFYFFWLEPRGLQKETLIEEIVFSVDYFKIIELCVVHTWCHL